MSEKAGDMLSKIQKAIEILDNHIKQLENEDLRKMYEPELTDLHGMIKKDIASVSGSGIAMIETIYLKCRRDGKEIKDSYSIAKAIYNREYDKVNRPDLLTSIYEVIKGIKDRIAKERGQGQGQGKPTQQDGGTDFCVCPECGKKIEHERGKPCNEIKCPDCDVSMAGE